MNPALARRSPLLEGREPYAEVLLGPNRVSLLRDGYQAYPAMLSAIEAAQSTVTLETYILRDDGTGKRFIRALCERAAAGVEVLLLFDNSLMRGNRTTKTSVSSFNSFSSPNYYHIGKLGLKIEIKW